MLSLPMVSDPEVPHTQPSLSANTLTTGNSKTTTRGVSTLAALAVGADTPKLDADDIDRIIQSRHDRPHRVLGPHAAADGSSTVVRAFLPGADHAVLLRTDAESKQYEMRRAHPDGFFEVHVPAPFASFDYAFLVDFGCDPPVRLADPYRFRPARFSAEDD